MNIPTTKRFCIQCRDFDSDTIGSFVYEQSNPFRAVSPVFESCFNLFQWMNRHGWSTGVLADFMVYENEAKSQAVGIAIPVPSKGLF